jgi:hypothetical protein
MTTPYKIKSLELAATIKTVTSIDPTISFDERGFGYFTFPETPPVVAVVMGYESDLQVNAREVLNTRNELFKRIRNKGGAL